MRTWYEVRNFASQKFRLIPVCRLDIRQDSEFSIGYGYPKTAFKREPDTDKNIRNIFLDRPIRGFTLLEKVAHGQWFIVSYDSANKQKHHKSHRMQ